MASRTDPGPRSAVAAMKDLYIVPLSRFDGSMFGVPFDTLCDPRRTNRKQTQHNARDPLTDSVGLPW